VLQISALVQNTPGMITEILNSIMQSFLLEIYIQNCLEFCLSQAIWNEYMF